MRRESYISNLEEHLQSLGVWEKLTAGQLNCFVCRHPVDLDTFGIVFRDDDGYSVTCNKLDCIRAITLGMKK